MCTITSMIPNCSGPKSELWISKQTRAIDIEKEETVFDDNMIMYVEESKK